MKVDELKIGMLFEPAGDQEVFRRHQVAAGDMPYIVVRFTRAEMVTAGTSSSNQKAMYLGNRKDMAVTHQDFSWSARFALFNGEVVAVDPAAWKRIRAVA